MFAIIVNPVSGGGRNQKTLQQVKALLQERGLDYRLFCTECEGDGGRQTKLALDSGCEAIVCIGGDGTISEVIGEMANSGKVLYIVPGGTGNDFARAANLMGEPIDVFRAQLDGERTKIDCGSINGRAFINVSGSGFDVDVLRKTEELKAVYPGAKAYRKAVMSIISSYRAKEIEVSIDGGPFETKRVTIIEIANGRYFGGGMHVAPGASYQDGLFDVVTVKRVPSWGIPFLLPLFILGIHVRLPVASVVQARQVVLRSREMIVNIDGRLEPMDEARYEMLPGALDVMLPKK
ncbi:MAG: diacylglycerol kinase family lipid kinase [Clostridia bacterium]|nr:diacylglycerol kinase family lipid kinase [Clostridia bacterium]